MVSHALHADFLRTDFNGDWIGLIITNEVCNFIIKRSAEKNGLAVFLALVEDLANRFHETHVRHSVCFVEHDHCNVIQ